MHDQARRACVESRGRRLVTVILGWPPEKLDPRRLSPGDRCGMTEKLDAAIAGVRLSILTRQAVQDSLAKLRDAGLALSTCNHYRAGARAFSNWCQKAGRTRENVLRGVTGFNAKEDRRHDRRTISLEELFRLIDATQSAPDFAGMSGMARAYATAWP